MATSTTTSLCRLTVMAPRTRLDLAVPLGLTVAELLTMLVNNLGRDVADEGAEEGGFVLQRGGEPPLDPALSLAATQIHDGDVLHLRMRSMQLPEVAYDDVLDAVATGVLSRSMRWSADHTARACTWSASVAVLFTYLACLLSGPSWAAPAAITGGLAVLLMGGAIALDRGYDQVGPARTAATLAVIGGALSGAMIVGGDQAWWQFGATQLMPAGAAAVLMSVIGLLVLSSGTPGFVAVIGSGVLAVIGAAVSDFADRDVRETAAFTAGIALALSPAIPMAAFKLSRLVLPPIPTDAADLKVDGTRINGSRVLEQAARADQYMTGLVVTFSMVIGTASVLLAGGSTWARLLAAVLGLICLFRARLFTGRSQRLSMLLAATVAAVAVVGMIATESGDLMRMLAVALPVGLLALVLLGLVVVLPGRRYTPPMGRMADIVEALLVLSVLPLILGIVGIYDQIRGITSNFG